MSTTTSARPLSETVEAISDVIRQGMMVGMDLFESLSRDQTVTMLGDSLRKIAPQLQRSGSCDCRIPPPCWIPRALGDVVSHVCPGGTATIRIQVTNCTLASRDIKLEPAAKPGKQIKVEPPSLSLGPMERGFFVASMSVAADAGFGQEDEVLLWIRGCLDHYLRWTVRVAKRGADCCHEVAVDDCPDFVHHWYDHFYCQRPCRR